MIRITSQDGMYQYDELGRPITEWNEKYCGWVILPEYENEAIDWQNDENGISEFPRGGTKAYFEKLMPGAENYPDITVIWTWDHAGFKKAFHEDFKNGGDTTCCVRSWGYLDYDEQTAIKFLGHYCDFNVHAINTKIIYNEKTIFDGKLE